MNYGSEQTVVAGFSYNAEYPIAEDFDEAIEFCGGPEGALNVIRASNKQSALQGPKDKVRKAIKAGADIESADFLEMVSKAQDSSRGYQPTGRRQGTLPGHATKRQATDAVVAMAETDPDAFAELLEKYGS